MQLVVKNEFAGNENAQEIFGSLLKNRGFKSRVEVEEFLKPPSPTLDYLLAHISVDKQQLVKAQKLILKAIAGGEDLCVFGDYDADGITSTAIMWQSLMLLAKGSRARVMPFIPDRARHGYGLSTKAIDDIFSGLAFKNSSHPDFQPSLLITVDNGIVAHEAVAALKAKGVTVIITDHHLPSAKLPAYDALIHSTDTSGAGISYLTSLYLTDSRPKVVEMLDLACIGVVADQMPLIGVNRSLVVHGLHKLSHTDNCGLQSMFKQAGIADKKITAYDINYVIAPRINAVGRLDNPLDALRLLCSNDQSLTQEIAAKVEKYNETRQSLTDRAIKKALKDQPEHNLIIASSPDFHEGIIGLVAGRLVEAHSRPAIVISIGEKVSKGSARSLSGVNITALMRQHDNLLLNVGGHELAGGFSLETKNIAKFTKALYGYADKNINPNILEKQLVADGELNLGQVSMTLVRLILGLEPFGMSNVKPKFLARNLRVLEDRVIGKNGNHRKLVVEQNGVTRDVIWFNGVAKHPLREIKTMVFSAEINVWRDRESIQLNAQYVETI